jgi:tetratricopeptide (TPR) repeat protein
MKAAALASRPPLSKSAATPRSATVDTAGFVARPWFRYGRWALLVAAVGVIYAPAIDGALIWDDHGIYISANELLRQPDGIYRAWFTNDPPDYYPLTYTHFWLIHSLVGEQTPLYHVANVVLHLATVGVLYALLRRLKAPYPYFVVLLFAVHPLQLETVAWISQAKTLLGTLLGFAAAYDYLGARDGRSKAARWRGPLWFFLGLAGKPVLITLPPLLALYEWLCGERNLRTIARRTWPYFASSLVLGIVGIIYQQKLIGGLDVRNQDLAQRLASLGWAAWFYVLQTFRVDALNFVYPRWQVDATSVVSWLPNLAALGVLWGTWRFRSRLGWVPFAAWTTYLVTMFPSLGLADVFYWRYSYVGDHYVYQSLPALLVIVAWCGERLVARLPNLRSVVAVVAGVAVAASGYFAWARAPLYQKEELIWLDTLAQHPGAFLALSNLGGIRDGQGRTVESLQLMDRALEIEPHFYEAWVRKGDVLAEREDWHGALECYRRGHSLAPRIANEWYRSLLGEAQALHHLGEAGAEAKLREFEGLLLDHTFDADSQIAALLCRSRIYLWSDAGRRGDAARQNQLDFQIDQATALSADVRLEAAHAWYEVAEIGRSLKVWEQVLRDKPNDAERLADAGLTALRGGDARRAIELLEQAGRLEPGRISVHSNLGIARMTLGETEAALPHFREAVQLAPDDARMHANLALACSLARRPDDAARAYRRVLELEPDNFAARRDLAWLLATSQLAGPQTAAEALRLAQQACEQTNSSHPAALDALGAALALAGRFEEAAAAADRAVAAAAAAGATAEEQQPLAARAALYRQGQAYREP